MAYSATETDPGFTLLDERTGLKTQCRPCWRCGRHLEVTAEVYAAAKLIVCQNCYQGLNWPPVKMYQPN